MMHNGYMAGVSDYDWSAWQGAPLTSADKDTAAAIAENLKNQAEYQTYMDQSEDPLLIKFAVQYALRHRITAVVEPKPPVAKIPPVGKIPPVANLPADVDLSKINLTNVDWAKSAEVSKYVDKSLSKSETPWLLYAAGAAVLFLLLRK